MDGLLKKNSLQIAATSSSRKGCKSYIQFDALTQCLTTKYLPTYAGVTPNGAKSSDCKQQQTIDLRTCVLRAGIIYIRQLLAIIL